MDAVVAVTVRAAVVAEVVAVQMTVDVAVAIKLGAMPPKFSTFLHRSTLTHDDAEYIWPYFHVDNLW